MSKKSELQKETERLQRRSQELTAESETLEVVITQKTQALSASLLAGKDDDRLLNDLTKKRLRLDAVQGAILQAGEEVKRLSAEIAVIDLAEAEKQLSALDKQSEKLMVDIKTHFETMFDLLGELESNQNTANQLFFQFRIKETKKYSWIKNSNNSNWLHGKLDTLRIDLNRIIPNEHYESEQTEMVVQGAHG